MFRSRIFRQIALAITLIAVVSMSAYAQRGGGGGGRGGFGGGGFGGGGRGGFGGGNAIFTLMRSIGDTPASFAMRADVRKELDLSEDQSAELRDVVAKSSDRRAMMQDLGIDFASLRDMSEDETAKLVSEVQEKVAKKHEEVMKDVADILSAKQTSRLKELRFQYTALTQRDPAQALREADIKVDQDDEEKIKAALADVEKELAAKIAKLRRTAYMEAMASVVNESKLESLLGEDFVFEAGGFGGGAFGRGGPGGGPGGPGQARGGRNRGGGAGGPGGAGGNRPRRPSGDDAADEPTNPRRRR